MTTTLTRWRTPLPSSCSRGETRRVSPAGRCPSPEKRGWRSERIRPRLAANVHPVPQGSCGSRPRGHGSNTGSGVSRAMPTTPTSTLTWATCTGPNAPPRPSHPTYTASTGRSSWPPAAAADGRCHGLGGAHPAVLARRNNRVVQASVVHFQLRHLLWATGKHHLYYASEGKVFRWSPLARKPTLVLNLSGIPHSQLVPNVFQLSISTLCAKHGLLAVGGFHAELVVRSLNRPGLLFSDK